jgi:hypothetical protein
MNMKIMFSWLVLSMFFNIHFFFLVRYESVLLHLFIYNFFLFFIFVNIYFQFIGKLKITWTTIINVVEKPEEKKKLNNRNRSSKSYKIMHDIAILNKNKTKKKYELQFLSERNKSEIKKNHSQLWNSFWFLSASKAPKHLHFSRKKISLKTLLPAHLVIFWKQNWWWNLSIRSDSSEILKRK